MAKINHIGFSEEGLSFGINNDSYRSANRRLRKDYQYAARYQPGITAANAGANLRGTVKAAQRAGLHPLFALGGSAGGSAPAFVGAQESGNVGGSFSSKRIRPEEAAMIRESNARTDLLKAQRKQVEAETAVINSPNTKTIPLEDGPAPQAEGLHQVMGNAKFGTSQSQSAQGAEDRYHELGGFFQGLVNAGGDVVYNFLRGREDSIIDLQNAFKRWAKSKGLNFRDIYQER